MNKMFTREDAKSFIASEKTKEGKKWESFVERRLTNAGFLPKLKEGESLVGSIFKSTKFSFKIDELDDSGHQKITDLYLPKFNHIIEDKTGLSDSTEQAIAFSIKSLIETKEFGDNFKFILIIDKKPSPAMMRRLESRAKTYSKHFEFYIGEDGLQSYINSLLSLDTKVIKKGLPMGTIEWVNFEDLIDNDKNRDINIPHVYDLMDSLLSQTRGGTIRGLLRTFIGFKRGGKIHLVDAHHCKRAGVYINDYTEYEIKEVPVYVLGHLDHLTEEEMTTLMSTINTLVLKWETFQYVKIWEKTFESIGDSERLYPYQKLRQSMEQLSEDLGQSSPNQAPIVQAFCLDNRADESNWSMNTKKINYGTLYFDSKTFENKLNPIVKSVKKLANKIDSLRKVVGSEYRYKNEWHKVPSKNVGILRAYATELSLQEKDRNDINSYYKSLDTLSNGYWETSDILPTESDRRLFETEDWKSIYNFPKTGDDMKKFVVESLLPDVTKKVKRNK